MQATSTKLTHEQAVQQLQAAMAGGATLANHVAPAPPAASVPVSQLVQPTGATGAPSSGTPIPPELAELETDAGEGLYVDDLEFGLAQSRVKRWLELDAEMSTLSTALRDRRREKEDLNKHLLVFMESNQIPHFEMSKGNLSVAVSKHKQPLNQKFITEKVEAVQSLDADTKAALLKSIFEDRVVTERHRLKHVKAK